MKKIIYLLTWISSLVVTSVFAAEDSTNILWISNADLRNWNITFSDIPKAIQNITSFVLWFATTIAMIMIIVWWLRYSLWSVEWSSPNKTKAQDTIKYWITWMIISVSAWFIVNVIIKILYSNAN